MLCDRAIESIRSMDRINQVFKVYSSSQRHNLLYSDEMNSDYPRDINHNNMLTLFNNCHNWILYLLFAFLLIKWLFCLNRNDEFMFLLLIIFLTYMHIQLS